MKVVVAGGGLAGAAAAAGLAQAGINVTLIEREPGPRHKICGEFLSAEAQTRLSQLGLRPDALGGAPISRLRLIRGEKSASTELPFRAIGLSRYRLDEALLQHAENCGAKLRRGHSVRGICVSDKLTLEVEGIGPITADILLLATGKHEIRGSKREAALPPDRIGFKMYFRLLAPARCTLDQHIELIFFPGGYAGLQMIEDGIANFCLLVDRITYRRCGGTWPQLLAYLLASSALLAARLAGAEALLAQPLTIYRVPYGFIHRPGADDPPGLFRLGDQAGVTQSFTGDGMSIALHSAALAVQAVLSGQNAACYHRRLAAEIRGQISRAEGISTLMNHPAMQAGLFGITRLWPGSLRIAASLTRLRQLH